jgi:pyrimidine-nucleoside phosphorylase
MKADDVIDYAAGVMFDKKTGDAVNSGDVIARIQLGSSTRDADELRKRFLSFVTFGEKAPEERPLVHERLI